MPELTLVATYGIIILATDENHAWSFLNLPARQISSRRFYQRRDYMATKAASRLSLAKTLAIAKASLRHMGQLRQRLSDVSSADSACANSITRFPRLVRKTKESSPFIAREDSGKVDKFALDRGITFSAIKGSPLGCSIDREGNRSARAEFRRAVNHELAVDTVNARTTNRQTKFRSAAEVLSVNIRELLQFHLCIINSVETRRGAGNRVKMKEPINLFAHSFGFPREKRNRYLHKM